MRLDLKQRDGVSILVLEGRLVDGQGEQQLREGVEVLVASGRVRVVVDLSEVRVIDSAGLGQLVACARRVAAAGGSLKVLHPQERVVRVMDVAKVLPRFEVFATEEEAVASFSGGVGAL